MNLRATSTLALLGAMATIAAFSRSAAAQSPADESNAQPPASAQSAVADDRPSETEPEARAAAETPPAAPDAKELVRNSRVEVLDARLHSIEGQLKLVNQQLAAQRADDVEAAPEEGPLTGGPWYIGGTLGLDLDNGNNTRRLLDVAVDDKRYGLSITGVAGKVLVDRSLGVGLALRYSRSKVEGTFDTGSGLEDRGRIDQELAGGPSLRQFLPLSGPIFVYYQATLYAGIQDGVNRVFTDVDTSTVTTYKGYSLGLNIQPGVAVFASKKMAVELGVDVLGIDLSWRDTVTDYTIEGSRTQASFNLDVNLLTLQFAFVGYF